MKFDSLRDIALGIALAALAYAYPNQVLDIVQNLTGSVGPQKIVQMHPAPNYDYDFPGLPYEHGQSDSFSYCDRQGCFDGIPMPPPVKVLPPDRIWT